MQKQVLLSFSIRKYHDEVICDVVPMHASHIFLGGPWKFDRRGNYDNFKNHFSFMKDKKLITLVPLTPKQVYEDQVRLKQKCDSKKNEKEKERKEKKEEKQEEKEIDRRKEGEKRKESERKRDLKVNNEVGKKTKKDQEVTDEKGGETKGKESFYTKDSKLKNPFYSNKPMFVLLYKETFLNINDLDSYLPSVVSSLLKEFKYVILEDDPKGLPPEETKELQSQVEELISPCVLVDWIRVCTQVYNTTTKRLLSNLRQTAP